MWRPIHSSVYLSLTHSSALHFLISPLPCVTPSILARPQAASGGSFDKLERDTAAASKQLVKATSVWQNAQEGLAGENKALLALKNALSPLLASVEKKQHLVAAQQTKVGVGVGVEWPWVC
jgi:hypothetical protein